MAAHWTIHVCPLCGSDDYDSTRDDSKCYGCGEWMNVEPVEVVPADQLRGAVEALEQARDLVAQAYSDDEHDDSPGNMAYAVLNAALARFGGQ